MLIDLRTQIAKNLDLWSVNYCMAMICWDDLWLIHIVALLWLLHYTCKVLLIFFTKFILFLPGQFLSDNDRSQEAADNYVQAAEISAEDFELVFNTANALRLVISSTEQHEFLEKR